MVYLITGKSGQVGRALAAVMGEDAVSVDRQELDLADIDSIKNKLDKIKPSVIFNAAAYTSVDKAEDEEDLAGTINADAAEIMADWAFSNNIAFIHYSTDYVYPGTGNKPWNEDNDTAPVNAYGRTKLAGEQKIIELSKKHKAAKFLIFRTSWVYDESGKNFLNTMLRLGKEKEIISVVADQFGAPTYAGDLAINTVAAVKKAILMKEFPSGVYNMCGGGEATWHEFAEEIFRMAEDLGYDLIIRDVKEINTSEFPSRAKRPLNSRLSMDKLEKTFNITMPDWKESLKLCLKRKI